MNWFKVHNDDQIDIHTRVIPQGEAPREITICSNVKPQHANLIEAAPEIAHILEVILDVWDSNKLIGPTVYHDARAALAKADFDKEHQT